MYELLCSRKVTLAVVVDSTGFTSVVIIVSQVKSVQHGQFIKWQYTLLGDHSVSRPSTYVAAACVIFSSECHAA